MATTYLNRLTRGRDSSITERERSYTEHYLIRSDSNSEDPRAVYFTVGTPLGGDSYGDDKGAVVRSVAMRQLVDYDWQYWVKTCTFSSRPFEGGPNGSGTKPGTPGPRGGFNDQSPVQELPTYATSGVWREVPAIYDRNGKAYRASSGEPFNGVTKEATTFVLEIDRNVQLTHQAQQYEYLENGGAVNTDAVFGTQDIGKWRVAQWNSNRQWRNGFEFFKEKLSLHYRSEGWRRYLLDRGRVHQKTSELNTTSTLTAVISLAQFVPTKPQVPLDVYGTPIGNPVLLDGRGNALKDITTTLTSSPNEAAISFNVASTLKFPDVWADLEGPPTIPATYSNVLDRPNGLYIRIDAEVMQVLVRGDGAFTSVARGARGTQAASHTTGTIVYMHDYFQEFVERPELSFRPLGINWSIAGGG